MEVHVDVTVDVDIDVDVDVDIDVHVDVYIVPPKCNVELAIIQSEAINTRDYLADRMIDEEPTFLL